MFLPIAVIFFLLIIYAEWNRGRGTKRIWKLSQQLKSKYIPLPFLGHAYKILWPPSGRMAYLKKIGEEAIENDGVVGIWLGRKFYTVICDAVIAETVLRSCHEKAEFLNILHDLLGNGSIFAPVFIWRQRRKLILPTFTLKNIRQFLPIFSKRSNIMVDRLKLMAGKGTFSIAKYLTYYMIESVCEAVLGDNLQRDQNEFIAAFKTYCRLATERMSNPFLHFKTVYRLHPSYNEYYDSIKMLRSFVDEIIASKTASSKPLTNGYINNDEHLKSFLELFVEESNVNKLTNDELREEVLVLAIAGTDTSSVGTSFVCSVLSRYPDVQERLFNEIYNFYGGSNRTVTIEDISKLKYLDAVVKETLRVYPPVPVISRRFEKDVQLPSGLTLVEDTGTLLSIWSLHRNPKYWGPNAEEFNPERFLNGSSHHSNAFMPFSWGPRNCIGYQYAMISMKIAVMKLLRNFKLLPPSVADLRKPLSVTFDIMLRDLDRYQLKLEKRFN